MRWSARAHSDFRNLGFVCNTCHSGRIRHIDYPNQQHEKEAR